VKYLLELNCISLGAKTKNGETLLHLACQKGNFDIVKLLFETNFEFEKIDKSGNTDLHFACEGLNLEVIKFLFAVKRVNVNTQNVQGRTGLFELFSLDRFQIVLNVLKEVAEYLIWEQGADLDIVDKNGLTCLTYLTSEELNRFSRMSRYRRTESEYLIALILELNVRNSKESIFEWVKECYRYKNNENLRISQEAEALKLICDKYKEFFFSLACIWKREDVVKFVFEQIFHCEMKQLEDDVRKESKMLLLNNCLEISIKREQTNIIQFLLEIAKKKQLNVNLFQGNFLKSMSLEIFKIFFEEELKKQEYDVVVKNIDLGILCRGGKIDIIRYLLEKAELFGINLFSWTDDSGKTLLHHICHGGSFRDCTRSTIKYLIEKWPGIVKTKDNNGNTPFHEFCSYRHPTDLPYFDNNLTRYLIETEPNVLLMKNNDGKIPLQMIEGQKILCDETNK